MREPNWNEIAEEYQQQWRDKKKVLPGEYGTQNKVTRNHILPIEKWLFGTWHDTEMQSLLEKYLEVEQVQANRGKHNLKSSWTQCANIFFPFRYHPHMKYMLVSFLNEELSLDISSIDGVDLEYSAPGKLTPKHLLGESGGKRGSGQTSPDVAISFTCSDGKCGIYLIENKYTEHHFYACSAAKKIISDEHKSQGLEPNPDPGRCRNVRACIDNPSKYCHQMAWGRKYWHLLNNSVDKAIFADLKYCPAMRDGYQLFRQQALAQGIADSNLFDYVISGVAYDERNKELIGCLSDLGLNDFRKDWSKLFNADSNVMFHCFSHQQLVSWVTRSRSSYIRKWSEYVSERYRY
ncbi:MAG: hypothetical protein PHR43_02615 [Dehalococcoidales bacterium]|nr:hypothetical protein [Dehalococcoidales bacterium]